jgi:hypothetical protein
VLGKKQSPFVEIVVQLPNWEQAYSILAISSCSLAPGLGTQNSLYSSSKFLPAQNQQSTIINGNVYK